MICAEVIETSDSITLRDSDIRVDTFRASGAGGQHRNKTDSAVRMTHLPTGTVATATESRSQHQNRKSARARLAQKLSGSASAIDVVPDVQWNWCEWRDEVTLPSGKKKSMAAVYRKGL